MVHMILNSVIFEGKKNLFFSGSDTCHEYKFNLTFHENIMNLSSGKNVSIMISSTVFNRNSHRLGSLMHQMQITIYDLMSIFTATKSPSYFLLSPLTTPQALARPQWSLLWIFWTAKKL